MTGQRRKRSAIAPVHEPSLGRDGAAIRRFDAGLAEAAKVGDLNVRQVRAMFAILLKPGITLGQIAKVIQTVKPNVCRSVDKLEDLKLAVRVDDATDGRFRHIFPTEAGVEFCKRVAAGGAE